MCFVVSCDLFVAFQLERCCFIQPSSQLNFLITFVAQRIFLYVNVDGLK
jgi:hypothetical protein